MNRDRQGSTSVMERPLELAKYSEGSRILDMGCGEGDLVNYLCEKGFRAEGINMNLAEVNEAKEKYPEINVKFGDPCFLDDYMSFTFDGIIFNGILSATTQPDEALHEAYCVMKKGGRLIIADFYEKNPDPGQVRAVAIEADRQARIPHQEGDCDEGTSMRFVNFRFEGAFYREPLIRQLEEEIGFRVMAFEDVADGLEVCGKTIPDGADGYFILVAQKPL